MSTVEISLAILLLCCCKLTSCVTFVDRGQEIEIPGTRCYNTVCRCRWRDGFVPAGDHFCTEGPKCLKGQEMSAGGVLLCSIETYCY